MRILTILTLFILKSSIWAQTKEDWTVLLVKKGFSLENNTTMFLVSPTGFYLYENCSYNIELKNGQHLKGRLIKVKQDTLIFTNYFNSNVAVKAHSLLDTFEVYFKNLERLYIGEGIKYKFDEYDFFFKKESIIRMLPSKYVQLYANDTMEYELAPYLKNNYVTSVFEEYGKIYYYEGGTGLKKTVKSKKPPAYTKRSVFWYIPNQIEQINGLSIGLWAENLKNDETNERDSLVINGLNMEVDPIMLFILIRGVWYREYPDSIEYYNRSVKDYYSTTKNGISISVLGSVGSEQINGINVGGINTVVDRICGVSITGLNNFAYISKGFSFALIRNRSTLTRGIQIGMFNKTMDLRGIQIGLWNKNGKRSLPLFNWQFKAKA